MEMMEMGEIWSCYVVHPPFRDHEALFLTFQPPNIRDNAWDLKFKKFGG
jgi:hypothetical protein